MSTIITGDHLRRSLSTDDQGRDRDLDEMIQVDPCVSGTNNRRSDKDLARMLDLIDSLPISTNGKDGPQ